MGEDVISQLRGKLLSSHPRVVVEVGGVGFELMIPEKDVEQLSPTDGDTQFFTYLYVREDRLNLFGFLLREDRELFLRLIEVSGVGPKLALGVLSLYPAEQVVAAIKRGDARFLQKLPGLGKKTAERLCMELKDKLDDITAGDDTTAPVAAGGIRDEVVLALTSLGMSRHAAETALDKMNWRPDDERPVEDVVREALRYVSAR